MGPARNRIDPTAAPEERASEPPLGLAIDVVHEAGDWSGFGDVAQAVAAAAAATARHPAIAARLPAAACLALASDAVVCDLNRTWRGQNKPTNVLSFPAQPMAQAPGEPPFLGDVVLAAETILREAAGQAIPIEQHLQHLVVHGLLHLMGYDHETDAEAGAMEALETAVLATLGIPDPYLAVD